MIPVNELLLGTAEAENVQECLRTGWISSSGRFIEEFEHSWARFCGRAQGVAVCNGTAALQLAVACLGLERGAEVIIPTFTIVSCALAVLYNECVPVLVDCDPETWCMDVNQVEARITSRTRAIMAVHIYGHPVDMDPLLAVAERHSVAVIEDAAEAHGAAYKGQRCGSFGALSTFSFYANKIVTTGEGGMILTDESNYADRVRALRNLAFRPDRRFYHTEMGHNFRFTNLQAAVGLGQLTRIENALDRKRGMARRYTDKLADVEGLRLPVEREWARSVYWMYGIVLEDDVGLDAATFGRELAQRGVETRPFFLGMHEQPVLRNRGLFADDRHPVAERLARRGLYLPSGLALTDAQQDKVVDAVISVLSGGR